jgi:hypothetical protein
VLNVVYINQGLTCTHAIEKSYYSAGFKPICFFCGTVHEPGKETNIQFVKTVAEFINQLQEPPEI